MATDSSKSGEDMTWMYKGDGSLINREDYLLGKKVDRNFELLGGSEVIRAEGADRFEQLVSRKGESKSGESSLLDLETIRKEDPLVAIKTREEQLRREIVDNPLKMKRLQRIVAEAMGRKMKKALGKEKMRHRSSSDDSSLSSADSTERRRNSRHSSGSRRRREEKVRRSSNSNRSSDGHDRRRQEQCDKSCKRARWQQESARRHPTNSDEQKNAAERAATATSSQIRDVAVGRATSSTSLRDKSDSRNVNKTKLGEVEKEKRRQEMLANAEWREEQREKNLRGYREFERLEEKKNASGTADFIRPMLSSAADKSTLERRIKSNIHGIQRTYNAMDKNFVKK